MDMLLLGYLGETDRLTKQLSIPIGFILTHHSE